MIYTYMSYVENRTDFNFEEAEEDEIEVQEIEQSEGEELLNSETRKN